MQRKRTRKLKKTIKIAVFLLVILALSIIAISQSKNLKAAINNLTNKTSASGTAFKLDDFVFYDPVNNKSCSQNNYWSPYRTDTTCYRFVVIDPSDTASKSTIKVMLDHDVAYDTYNNYQSALASATNSWTFSGTIRIMTANELMTLFNIDISEGPTLTGSGDSVSSTSVAPAHKKMGVYMTNTSYYVNGSKSYYIEGISSSAGWWTSTEYSSNTDWIYTLTENGNCKLYRRTNKKGIRPVIEVEKSKVNKGDYNQNITLQTTPFNYTSAGHLNHADPPVTKQFNSMQGFAIANNKVVFHSNESEDSGYGILYWDSFSSPSYSNTTPQTNLYYDGDHGNSITYNSSTNKFVAIGKELESGNSSVNIFNANTMAREQSNVDFGRSIGGIAYNKFSNTYAVSSGARMYLLDSSNKTDYSMESVSFSTDQGVEYHNGFLYKPQHNLDCPNSHQLWCLYNAYTPQIYVYNAKINHDGTPNKDFGHLSKIYTVNNIYESGTKLDLEIEEVSFYGEYMYVAFSPKKAQKSEFKPFKIYKIAKDEVELGITLAEPEFEKNGDQAKITITCKSKDEIQASGWTHETDDWTIITKNYAFDGKKYNVNVCDYYENCTNVEIDMEAIYQYLNSGGTGTGGGDPSTGGTEVNVTGVSVSPTSKTLYVGGTQQLTATVSPSDASNKAVTWKSGNTSVATVSDTGLVTAKATGTATITVTTVDGGKTATSTITVVANPPTTTPVTGVSVSPSSVSLEIGDTKYLTATVSPSDASNKAVTWKSGNSSVATVSDTGLVTAKATGTATITVTTVDGGKTATSTITVVEKSPTTIPVTGVSVSPKSIELDIGEEATITATVSPSNATNKKVSWSSSNQNIVTVDANGKVTGVKAGTATITVVTENGGKQDTTSIVVSDPAHYIVPPIEKITINEKNITLKTEERIKLSYTIEPETAITNKVYWKSSDESIAIVTEEGEVLGVSKGTVTITAYNETGEVKAETTISVTNDGENPKTGASIPKIALGTLIILLTIITILISKYQKRIIHRI